MKKISICHTSKNKFQIPNIPELFKVPFEVEVLAKNQMVLNILTESCLLWTKTIEDSLAELPKFESLESVGALEYPKHQIEFWRRRERELEALIDEFSFPAYNRQSFEMYYQKLSF